MAESWPSYSQVMAMSWLSCPSKSWPSYFKVFAKSSLGHEQDMAQLSHLIPVHSISYHLQPSHSNSYHLKPFHTISYHLMQGKPSQYIFNPISNKILYHFIPSHTCSFHLIPSQTISYHRKPKLPSQTISYHLLPSPTSCSPQVYQGPCGAVRSIFLWCVPGSPGVQD